jgi:hypothetical protein
MQVEELRTLRAYKRSPGLSNSAWYKGFLVSRMAGTADEIRTAMPEYPL